MTDPHHTELLGNIGLFESLTDDDLRSLSNRLEESDYDEGQVVFKQGDSGDCDCAGSQHVNTLSVGASRQ